MQWPIKTALLSCTDKTNLIPLALRLHNAGVRLISTGGTAKVLHENQIPFVEISEFTGHPEAFQGRMKTISFKFASALLFKREDPQDEFEAAQLGVTPVDLVVCNLYPFERVAAERASEKILIENIDIGGPLMIRAAAKNFQHVTVLTDPSQYERFLQEFKEQGTSLEYRRELARAAFTRIAEYDVAIADKLGEVDTKFVTLKSGQSLRYGENPQQPAQVFTWNNAEGPTLKAAEVLQGKELSYNNMLDADAAWKAASDVHHLFEAQGAVAVVVKHGNPCGLVHADDSLRALERAWAGDPVSAFGGVIALTHTVDEKIASFFQDKFIEILLAPEFLPEALNIFKAKKNVRLLKLPVLPLRKNEQVLRSFNGGVLWQMEDETLQTELKSVTAKKLSLSDHSTALFGVLAAKHLKSNAIALVGSDGVVTELVGAGMGQPNRLDSLLRLALPRTEEKDVIIEDLIMVSDAFFPFADSVEIAAKAGITKIVQPGGSIKDSEVFAAADRLGIAMVTTGERHFRH